MSKQPKYRVGQYVMILEGTGVIDGRKDSGRIRRIDKVIEENWSFRLEDPVQFSYHISDGKLHESWLRALTGAEITGRI